MIITDINDTNSGFRQFQINTKEACDNSNTWIKLSWGLLEKEAEQLFTSWEPK
jgi:hypothetical protein